MLTDTAIHFSLLSGNDHSHCTEAGQVFEPSSIYDDDDNEIDSDGNMFDAFNNQEEFVGNNDLEDNSDIASQLMEKLKVNGDDNDGNKERFCVNR